MSDLSVIEDAVHYGQNVVIESAPGTGKSWAIIKKLQVLDKQFIFVADSIPLARDLGSSFDLPVYFRDQPEPDTSKPFITIPHHAPKFKDSNCILVVDEWHSLVTDYNYKDKTIDTLVKSFNGFAQIIGLTGTNIIDVATYKKVRVIQNRPSIPIKLVSYNCLLSAIVEAIEAHPDRTHVISLFDKSDFAKRLVLEVGRRGFGGEAVAMFNADVKHSRDITDFLNLNMFRAGTRIILTTYKQGFSIKGKNHMLHIVPYRIARHSLQDIVQICNRFRDPDGLADVNIYYNFKTDHPDTVAHLISYRKDVWDEARRQQAEYKSIFDKLTENQLALLNLKRGKVVSEHLDQSKKNLLKPDLSINYLQIEHNVYQKETNNIYASQDHLASALKTYNIEFTESKFMGTLSTGMTGNALKVAPEEFEAKVDEHLANDSLFVQDDVSEKICFLLQFFSREEVRLLMYKYGLSTQAWNRLKDQVEIQVTDSSGDIGIKEDVYNSFKVGERYTNSEIQAIFNRINKAHRQTHTSWMSLNKAVRTLRLYFSVKRKKNRATHQHEYEILSDNPLPYPITDMRVKINIPGWV